jgi:hypothetical protein
MAKELAKYKLRSTNRPATNPYLGTEIITVNEEGRRGSAYIGFGDAFVDAVAKALPRGISAFDPAFIQVEYRKDSKQWIISAAYLDGGDAVVLWSTANRPLWLKIIATRSNHGTRTKNTNRAASRVGQKADTAVGAQHVARKAGTGAQNRVTRRSSHADSAEARDQSAAVYA